MTFFFMMNTIRVILINILMHPSFVMAVNRTNEYEAEESASIHHKRTPHGSEGVNKGLLKRSDAFV